MGYDCGNNDYYDITISNLRRVSHTAQEALAYSRARLVVCDDRHCLIGGKRTNLAKKMVGQSPEHTIFKHALLNKLSGQFAGAASYLRHDKIVMVDATAGDGRDSGFSKMSSPKIFSRHLKFLARQRRCRAFVYMIEADQPTFFRLGLAIDEIAEELDFPELETHVFRILGDYRSPDVAAKLALSDRSIAFLYIDPNN